MAIMEVRLILNGNTLNLIAELLQIEILSAKDSKPIGKCSVQSKTTIAEVKTQVHKIKKALYPDRQSIRLEVRGKTLKDEDTLEGLNIRDGGKLYVKDLGPQIGWATVSGPRQVKVQLNNFLLTVYVTM